MDSKDKLDYEFVEKVNEDYICKLCSGVARDPNITSCCGECYCKPCVEAIISDKKPCSGCQETEFSSFLHRKYQTKILALRIRCTMKDRGCEWIGQLQQLDTHLDANTGDCMYVHVQCPKNCELDIQKCNLNKHLAEQCPNRDYICPHCSLKDTFRVVTEHFKDCPYYPIVCANRCGATFERGELEDHKKMCSLEKVQCEFHHTGCEAEFIRDKQEEHRKSHTQKHLSLVATALKVSQDKQEALEKKLTEQQQNFEQEQQELKQAMVEQRVELQEQLHQKDEKITEVEKTFDKKMKETEARFEAALKKQVKDFEEKFTKKTKKHTGKFHCCTWCSSKGNKLETCGCDSRMPGGYSGCGHGHQGHPGCKHWSCCGSTVEASECLA